jgi:hypothetical protein
MLLLLLIDASITPIATRSTISVTIGLCAGVIHYEVWWLVAAWLVEPAPEPRKRHKNGSI